jgi:hypothetical protein
MVMKTSVTTVCAGLAMSILGAGSVHASAGAGHGATAMHVSRFAACSAVAGYGHGAVRRGPSPPIAPESLRPLCCRKVIVRMIFPVLGNSRWHNGYNVKLGPIRHTAIDIAAPKMRPVVAPFSGIVGFKTQTFWIYGDNGYKCLGTHLNDDTPGTNDNRADPDYMFAPNLRRGDHVVAGQLMGYVGNSGKTTGPHLHFELFDRDGTLVNPFYSLKYASRISNPRPVLTGGVYRSAGESQIAGCIRGWDPTRRVLAILAVARKTFDGKAYGSRTPIWYRISLPQEVVEAAGGSDTLAEFPRDRPITLNILEPRGGRRGRSQAGCGKICRVTLPDEPLEAVPDGSMSRRQAALPPAAPASS